MSYQISADTGGTFIDVVINDDRGRKTIGKALTTHDRVSRGLAEAIESASDEMGTDLASILANTDLFIYGTTLATNAIVTRNVAKTALLTTEGFTDVLVLKEGGKLSGRDFGHNYPDPYIPRHRTFGVPERINSEGEVVVELDEASVRSILRTLASEHYEAIAVSLLWSIVNDAHESRIGEIINEELPGVPYTLSHRIAPIIREYRRTSATAIDASLKPLMQGHLRELREDLAQMGYQGQVLVSTNMGGVMGIDEVIDSPIHTTKSGPAMAPVAGLHYSLAEGLGGDMIVCDAGGTTFDVGLSRGGQLVYSRDTWLGGSWEGNLLGVSSVDIRSIGAGGGSIAWVDNGGLLRVGPQSAGSEPGPACYGHGGLEATVSDAATVLGYFNPDNFLGGRMALDVDAANAAVDRIAQRMGLGRYDTAWGILSLASDAMVKAVHEITISQGLNPAESTLVAGGGAAGMNILQIARELGSKKVVLPRLASALSATGMHFADIVKEEAKAFITSTKRFDRDGVNRTLDELEARLNDFLERTKLSERLFTVAYYAEARYQAQVWDVDTQLPFARFTSEDDVKNFVEEFHRAHESIFSIRDDASPVEIINWKARLTVEITSGRSHSGEVAGATFSGSPSTRPCYFGGSEPQPTKIYRPEHLEVGSIVHGPAVIEEPTTTLVIFPGMSAEISHSHNYILHTDGA